MDNRLADVQDIDAMRGKNRGDTRSDTGMIFPGDGNQQDLAQEVSSTGPKARYSTCRPIR